jgi:hypothetical protein
MVRVPLRFALLAALVALSGCAGWSPFARGCTARGDCPAVRAPGPGDARPQARPAAGPATAAALAPAAARTPEQIDTTTAAERRAAARPAERPERSLGTTIASLGAADEPGFWLKTPLVADRQEGRVAWAAGGTSVQVTLMPREGPPGGGSLLSLPAMRVLGVALTALPELTVYAR